MGIYFTIGIEALFSEHIQVLARSVPSERILTETDNPGGPKAFIGGLGAPRLIEGIVDKIAELRNVKREEIITIVQSNLLHLIGDDPWFEDTNKHFLGVRENRF